MNQLLFPGTDWDSEDLKERVIELFQRDYPAFTVDRQISREVIARVLSGLSKTGTRTEASSLLRQAYPFHQRRGYEYQAWLRERRIALDQKFGTAKKDRARRPEYRLVMRGDRPWLGVYCPLCGHEQYEKTGGCIFCGRMWDRLKSLVVMLEYTRLRLESTAGDRLALLGLRDWLEEHGVRVEVPAK